MSISTILLDMRNERGLSQKDLAEAIGVSQSTIAKIEIGRNEATASTIRKLANYFGVTADQLLELEDDFGHKIETKSDTYTTEERKLINDFRQLSPALKKMLQDTIATWQHSEANKQTKNNA